MHSIGVFLLVVTVLATLVSVAWWQFLARVWPSSGTAFRVGGNIVGSVGLLGAAVWAVYLSSITFRNGLDVAERRLEIAAAVVAVANVLIHARGIERRFATPGLSRTRTILRTLLISVIPMLLWILVLAFMWVRAENFAPVQQESGLGAPRAISATGRVLGADFVSLVRHLLLRAEGPRAHWRSLAYPPL